MWEPLNRGLNKYVGAFFSGELSFLDEAPQDDENQLILSSE